MKVAFCIEKFENKGGMERVLAVIANALSSRVDITIITAYQHKSKDAFPLFGSIKRYDLGINTDFRFHHIIYNPMLIDYRNKMQAYLCSQQFDVVVSMGGLDVYFLPKIKDGSRKMVWFHFTYNVFYKLIKTNSLYGKIVAKALTYRRVYSAKKFDSIIAISKAEQKLWSTHCRNVVCIYNPITIEIPKTSTCHEKKVIAVGRLDDVKGFDLLIEAWGHVCLQYSDWALDIYGEGPCRQKLDELIIKQNLQNYVNLRGNTIKIAEELCNHSFLVLSSRTEAFPLSVVEAMSCSLPIVAYNCAPSIEELVVNGKNGIIVSVVGDVELMAEAICKMISSESERKRMGLESLKMANNYKINNIVALWQDLLFHNLM